MRSAASPGLCIDRRLSAEALKGQAQPRLCKVMLGKGYELHGMAKARTSGDQQR